MFCHVLPQFHRISLKTYLKRMKWCEVDWNGRCPLFHSHKHISEATTRVYSGARSGNKPKEYPQQRETKTVAKEDVYCPALFTLEVGRASCNHGTNTVWKKTLFQKRLRYCGQHARSSCKGFSSQRIAVRLTLHFIYLTYIIHIFFVLYITYIFYTIF